MHAYIYIYACIYIYICMHIYIYAPTYTPNEKENQYCPLYIVGKID